MTVLAWSRSSKTFHDRPHHHRSERPRQEQALLRSGFRTVGLQPVLRQGRRVLGFDVGNGCLFEVQSTGEKPPLTHLHVAFRAKSKAEVDAFYQAALEAGATDNGAPGPRPDYAENYYACFVLDPDGYNIEAMTNEA